ncbi:MAG: transcription antitermination factor NusB [bacterium]
MSRRNSRDEAFKVLYAREVDGSYDPEYNSQFTEKLVGGVLNNQEQLDEQLSQYLNDWRIDRIYPVERVLLRAGAFEILKMETSKAVVINEAVELAKTYGDEGTGSFVNGILDNFEKPTEKQPAE